MAKLIHQISDFRIYVTTSGGKAGKGLNKTASVQVRRDDCVMKSFRFVLAQEGSFKKAFAKAREYCAQEGLCR